MFLFLNGFANKTFLSKVIDVANLGAPGPCGNDPPRFGSFVFAEFEFCTTFVARDMAVLLNI